MINKTITIKPSNKMKEVLKVMQELKDLRKENSVLKFKNNKLKQQLILSGVVKRLWGKLNVVIAYTPLYLIDIGISVTTNQTFKEARDYTKNHLKRVWFRK